MCARCVVFLRGAADTYPAENLSLGVFNRNPAAELDEIGNELDPWRLRLRNITNLGGRFFHGNRSEGLHLRDFLGDQRRAVLAQIVFQVAAVIDDGDMNLDAHVAGLFVGRLGHRLRCLQRQERLHFLRRRRFIAEQSGHHCNDDQAVPFSPSLFHVFNP